MTKLQRSPLPTRLDRDTRGELLCDAIEALHNLTAAGIRADGLPELTTTLERQLDALTTPPPSRRPTA